MSTPTSAPAPPCFELACCELAHDAAPAAIGLPAPAAGLLMEGVVRFRFRSKFR